MAGPQAVSGGGNPGGYVPCHYTAPAAGIYSVVFYGPDGDGVDTDGGALADIDLANANNFNAAQLATVAAWDVTVRANDTSIADLNGRVFATALAASTAGNGRPLNITFYVTTRDGFVYKVDTHGLDPNGFALFGNQLGFLDADGNGPLDHDVVGTTNSSQLTGLAGNVAFAPPQYPISFTPLAPDTLAALSIPATAVAPAISALSFAGNVALNTSVVGRGGTFHFTNTVAGVSEIIISRDGTDFDPGNPLNRVLRAARTAGVQTMAWDGKDNAGNDFPVGANYTLRASLHAGEYHFPLLDTENSTQGGPTITLQNPPGGTCPFGELVVHDRVLRRPRLPHERFDGFRRRNAGNGPVRAQPGRDQPQRPRDRLRQQRGAARVRRRQRRQHERPLHRLVRRRQRPRHLDVLPEHRAKRDAQHHQHSAARSGRDLQLVRRRVRDSAHQSRAGCARQRHRHGNHRHRAHESRPRHAHPTRRRQLHVHTRSRLRRSRRLQLHDHRHRRSNRERGRDIRHRAPRRPRGIR